MRNTELNRAFKHFADDAVEVMNGGLDGKADLVDGKVPSTQLPSYVDDTVEGYYYNSKFYEDAQHTTEITGEAGKIYIDISSNKSYRWTGSVYTRIDECPAFGETQGTIYEGNKGKANADEIAAIKDGTNIDSFADVETALAGKANASDLGAAAAKGFDASPTFGNTNNAVSSDGVANALVPITAELVELVDSGAKNLINVPDKTLSTSISFMSAVEHTYAAGKYVFTMTTNNVIQLGFYFKNNGSSAGEFVTSYMSGGFEFVIDLQQNADSLSIWANVPSGNTVAVSDVMLCTKSAWDISHKIVPYCPSMAEMYAMIQAL